MTWDTELNMHDLLSHRSNGEATKLHWEARVKLYATSYSVGSGKCLTHHFYTTRISIMCWVSGLTDERMIGWLVGWLVG